MVSTSLSRERVVRFQYRQLDEMISVTAARLSQFQYSFILLLSIVKARNRFGVMTANIG